MYKTIIPDNKLEEYLKDKITSKPDYGYSTFYISYILSDWEERRKKEELNRKDSNAKVRRTLR